MKIVESKQMSALEAQAYKMGFKEEDFMEKAGKGVAYHIVDFVDRKEIKRLVILLCGKGNNAGDAYVAGCYLLQQGFAVFAYQIVPIASDKKDNVSPLCKKNYHRFLDAGGLVHAIKSIDELRFPQEGVIVDGLFGTGFTGTVSEPFLSVIKRANQSRLPIISIDIPSGLDGSSGFVSVEGGAIKATETIFLGLPKKGFFIGDGWNHVGKLRYVDFGLPKSLIKDVKASLVMLSPEMVNPDFPTLPQMINNRHKYQAGLVVGLAGSPGMPGAAMLSSLAALRSGAGIVRLLHPAGMESELASSPYELIRVPYGESSTEGSLEGNAKGSVELDKAEVDKVVKLMNEASAVFIGPGIGRGVTVRRILKKIFASIDKPCVIDADALTIIAEEKLSPPRQAVLTPHMGEMMRLLGNSGDSVLKSIRRLESSGLSELTELFDTVKFLQQCQAYAEQHKVTIVLKGGPSFIIHSTQNPNQNQIVIVNPYGDPGMATAGSGDVLTGMIAALLSQKLPPYEAAILGVYLHGIAGELAAESLTSYSMIASDIIHYLPEAFKTNNS